MVKVSIPRWSSFSQRIVGDYKVSAERLGPFLIYRSPDCLLPRWSLTHARTLRTIRKTLRSRETARRLGRALLGFDWNFVVDPKCGKDAIPQKGDFSAFPKGHRAQMRKAEKIAREWDKR